MNFLEFIFSFLFVFLVMSIPFGGLKIISAFFIFSKYRSLAYGKKQIIIRYILGTGKEEENNEWITAYSNGGTGTIYLKVFDHKYSYIEYYNNPNNYKEILYPVKLYAHCHSIAGIPLWINGYILVTSDEKVLGYLSKQSFKRVSDLVLPKKNKKL